MTFFSYLISPLNLYFCRIFSFWFISCTTIVLSVISLFEGTEQARRSVGATHTKFSDILELILLKLPGHYQMLLPFIVLTAAIITLARLNHTNEIVAAKGVGISVWQLITGLCGVALILGAAQLTIINPFTSALNNRMTNLEESVGSNAGVKFSILETGLWLKESADDRVSIIHIQRIDLTNGILYNVSFQNFDNNGNTFHSRIDAQTATLDLGFWNLKNVNSWTGRNAGSHLDSLSMPTSLSLNKILESNEEPESFSFWSLPRQIKILDRAGLSSLPYRLHWHGLIAKIGMMLTMILLAAAFTLRPIRQGYTSSLIALGIGSGFLLHFMSDIVFALGLADKVPVFLAAWAPTSIMALLSVALLIHLEDG